MTIEVKLNPTLQPSLAGGVARDSTSVNSPSKVSEKAELESSLKVEEKPEKEDSKQSISNEKVEEAVTSLNSSIQSVQRNLQFSVDKDLNRIVINVTDKNTDEVVRQIPSEDVLDLARNLQDIVQNRNTDTKSSGNSSKEGLFFSSTA